jgi:hypothetical protein
LNNIEKYKKREKQYDQANPDKRKNYQLKRNFGITLKEYNELYDKQYGNCAICNNYFKILCIDHKHITNKIRGLLCHKCNLLLGNANENIIVLKNAINYINQYEYNF